MENNTTEVYVDFESAKVLKEFGFRVETTHYYFEDGEFNENHIEDWCSDEETNYFLEEFYEDWNDAFLTTKQGERCLGCDNPKYFQTYSAPTLMIACKWIFENYGIWISANYNTTLFENPWGFSLMDGSNTPFEVISTYATMQEALNAAIRYTLLNTKQ